MFIHVHENSMMFTNKFTKTFIFHVKFIMNSYEVDEVWMKFMKVS